MMDRKVSIVTGSATGVGAATALMLAKQGCNVVVNYSRSADEAEASAQACREAGAEAIAVQADVSEDTECKRLVLAATDHWGRLDYLVNNAGTTKYASYHDLDGLAAEDFARIFAVNVTGAYQMIRAALPHLKANGDGAIVNNSSIASVTGIGTSHAYAASKAALNSLTKSMAHTAAPEVRVNAVAPGMIDTRWLRGNLGEDQYEGMKAQFEEALPLRRVATAEDVAEIIVWFLTGAPLVTGTVLIADAGIHIGQLPPGFSGE